MKASETLLNVLLKGPKQFLIPIYQRPYSWTKAQVAQLFDDVARVASSQGGGESDASQAHFIGSVVYVERGLYQASAVPELLVIDGQQRLTTFTLFVAALAAVVEETAEGSVRLEGLSVNARKLRNYFLFNADEEGELRFKLVLSQGDDPTLRAVLDGKGLPDEASHRVRENYEYLVECIRSSRLRLEEIYRGLMRLMVVQVALDRQNDNPQLIFESLNSTGLELSQADLVRNFVLMGLEPARQREIYQDHWLSMEKLLMQEGDSKEFDKFLRAWLAMRTGELAPLRQGYETFKRMRAADPDASMEHLVRDLHQGARYYARIALGQETHPRLKAVWNGLQALRIEAPTPFLMYCVALQERGVIDTDELLGIAELVESWVFRRMICHVPSNVLSRLFTSLPRYLDDSALLESFEAWLSHRVKSQRFPSDAEFGRELRTIDLYGSTRSSCQYALVRMENHGRKEPIEVGRYTIEHVMPQNPNLSEAWRAMLGAGWVHVQERWLHTLGNLTLTGYNPELSDRPFADKLSMEGGFADSPLRINRSLAKADVWDESAIEARGRELSEKALLVWRAPAPSNDARLRYAPRSIAVPVAEYEAASGAPDPLILEGDHARLYEILQEGLTPLGLTPRAQKSQISFQRPGERYSPVIACWPQGEALRVQLREELTEAEIIPDWFKRYTTGSGVVRIQIDVITEGQAEGVAEFVERASVFSNDRGEFSRDGDDS